MLPDSLLGVAVTIGGAGPPPPQPALLRDALQRRTRVIADRDHAWIDVRDVATFSVRRGQAIVVDPKTDADHGETERTLRGTVAAFVLAQHGRFALHGSAVDIDGRAMAIAGDSGSGKSTTALALAARGRDLLTDDITIVDLINGRPTIASTGRTLHLWPDAAHALGVRDGDARALNDGTTKLELPAPQCRPLQLATIVDLMVGPIDKVRVEQISATDALAPLADLVYRSRMLRELYRPQVLEWVMFVAAKATFVTIVRPIGQSTLDDVTSAIERLG